MTENNFTNPLIQFHHLVHHEDKGEPLPAPITLSTVRTVLYHCLLIRHSSIANCGDRKRFTNSLIQFCHLVQREDKGGPLPAPITLSTVRTGLYHCLLIRHSSIANCGVIKRVHKFFVCTHLVLSLFTLDNFITLSTTRIGVGLYQHPIEQNQDNKVCKMTTDQYQ